MPLIGRLVESVGRWIGRWIGQSVGRSINRSVGRSLVGRSIGIPIGRSVDWAVDRSVGRLTGRSVCRSAGRSVSGNLFSGILLWPWGTDFRVPQVPDKGVGSPDPDEVRDLSPGQAALRATASTSGGVLAWLGLALG